MKNKQKKKVMTLEDKIFCMIGKFVALATISSIMAILFIQCIERGCYY